MGESESSDGNSRAISSQEIDSNLWSVKLADLTGMSRVSKSIPFPAWPPFLFIGVVYVVSATLRLLGSSELDTGTVSQILTTFTAIMFVISGIYILSRRYADTISGIPGSSPEPDIKSSQMGIVDRMMGSVDRLVLGALWSDSESWKNHSAPPRLRNALVLSAFAIHLTYLFVLGNYSTVVSNRGFISGSFDFLFVIPFVYYPLIAEFTSILFNVLLGLPSRVRADRLLTIDDPDGYSGIRPVGSLINTATMFYAAGIILYTLNTVVIGRVFGSPVSVIDWAYIAVGTGIGLMIFLYPIMALNRIISLQKDSILEEIASRVKETGSDPRFFPATDAEDMETTQRYMQEYINMRIIRESHDYPINFRQFLSVFTTLVLPFILNYFSSTVLPSIVDLLAGS